LHLDDVALFDLAEAEQHRDVRMVERCQHARFPLEARPPIEIGQQRVVQHLERDLPSELCVFGTKDLAHSTGTQKREQAVRANGRAGDESHQKRVDYMSVVEAMKSTCAATKSTCAATSFPFFNQEF